MKEESSKLYALYTTDDVSAWGALVPPARSFFGSVEFARIVEAQTGYTGRLLVIEAGSAWVAVPFLLRPIAELGFAEAGEKRFDAYTPDYTGPIVINSDPFFGRNEFH